MEPIKIYKFLDGKQLEIYPDEDPLDPRKEFDNLCVMICFQSRHDLGDKHEYQKDFASWADLENMIDGDNPDCLILPLYLMDHSGLCISTNPFGCQWDSGQIGFIFITQDRIIEHFNRDRKKAEECLLSEVSTYDQYLQGDIYGFILRDKPCKECGSPGKNLESVWGYYGSDPIENGMSDSLGKDHKMELKKL